MTPDFIIKKKNEYSFILVESKYKQISGSDWEKLESNFGFHDYFYRSLCKNDNFEIVVILSGYWRDCQNNYGIVMNYLKEKYGEHRIYDFGDNVSEIQKFCRFCGYEDEFFENELKIRELFKIEKSN